MKKLKKTLHDLHALHGDLSSFFVCWIHANRTIDKVVPLTEQAKKDLDYQVFVDLLQDSKKCGGSGSLPMGWSRTDLNFALRISTAFGFSCQYIYGT